MARAAHKAAEMTFGFVRKAQDRVNRLKRDKSGIADGDVGDSRGRAAERGCRVSGF